VLRRTYKSSTRQLTRQVASDTRQILAEAMALFHLAARLHRVSLINEHGHFLAKVVAVEFVLLEGLDV
jgi:hypothetical protein